MPCSALIAFLQGVSAKAEDRVGIDDQARIRAVFKIDTKTHTGASAFPRRLRYSVPAGKPRWRMTHHPRTGRVPGKEEAGVTAPQSFC